MPDYEDSMISPATITSPDATNRTIKFTPRALFSPPAGKSPRGKMTTKAKKQLNTQHDIYNKFSPRPNLAK